ncbi:MAG: D-alanyl-D-alanine carboxypeptidase family protein [Clostridia bacterium]|nr:D-alanyl-D-alanine carboxypeptidase family protein [Clostridia bacterium]
MARTKKKKDPFKLVLVLTILFGVLGAGAIYGSHYIASMRSERLQVMTDEVVAENTQAPLAYEAALAAFEEEQDDGTNEAWPVPSGSGWEIVDLTSYPLESVTTRTIQRQDALYNGMLLVNEWHSRPEDFLEDTLVSVSKATDRTISVKDSSVRLFPDAVEAIKNALLDAKAQNLENYVAYEGYRSWDEQNQLFQKQMEKYKNLSQEEQIERAKKDVNYPGTSEFNTGLTLRLILYKKDDAAVNNLKFFESEQGIWLYNNSWKYGLIFRFPLADYPVKGTADKSYKTGVSVKLQAFRYVGKGNAAAMHAMDLCLEEYLDYLSEHPHIAVFEDGVLRYEIVRENVGNGDPFTVHVTNKNGVRNTVTGLDNMGFAVTVFEY